MRNFSATIGRFAQVVVRRRKSGAYDATTGLWVEGVPADESILAVVQPIGEDVQFLPENFRTAEAIKAYTEADIKQTDTALGQESDLLIVGTKTYKVIQAIRWPDWQYTKVLAARV